MAAGGTKEEAISHMEAGACKPTSSDEHISAEETSGKKFTCESNSSFTPSDVEGEMISSSKVSVPTRTIDLFRRISSGGKQIHIQILAGKLPTKECQDTQAVVLYRYKKRKDDSADTKKVLQDAGSSVEVEYQAAKTEEGKYVSKGVILTSAGRNPGYLLHLTVHHRPVMFKETLITALRVAEKHEIKSVAFPPYMLTLFGINQFIELIEEFAKLYRPVCVDFVQLFLTEMLFDDCQTIRKSGDGSSRLHYQEICYDIYQDYMHKDCAN